MRKILAVLLLNFTNIFGGVVKVAIAANVTYAIEDLKKEFNKTHPDIKIQTTISGSGKLTAQIRHGAGFDIFMSANMKYPNALFEEGLAENKPVIYAKGSLVLFSQKKRDFKDGVNIILSDEIKKIAVANPKLAPYGKATYELLTNLKLLDKVKSKFIFGESIGQTLIYTLKAADIGFVAKSTILSPKMKEYQKGDNWIDLDSKSYTPISQGMVILKKAKDNKDVKKFYDFILGDEAKKILTKYGYIVGHL